MYVVVNTTTVKIDWFSDYGCYCTAYANIFSQQECFPVGCEPPTRNRTGGLPDRDPPFWTETPLWTETPPPLDRDPPLK